MLVRRWTKPQIKMEKDAILPILTHTALLGLSWTQGCRAYSAICYWFSCEHIPKRGSLLILRQLRPRTAKAVMTMIKTTVNTTTIKIQNTIQIITQRGRPPTSAYGSFLAFLPRPPTPGTTYTALVELLSTYLLHSSWPFSPPSY
ncbi:hypothetical protein FIBSPDRAFT_241721 [Athelia psychrophila]|uniref:Uncharacterized protein n=1 Tax=Athelia psychrophila TaxID=1759441 RepID=A0A165Y6V3_9AGAM|nr:hypothetical protein FIBSPDRAFT_241721 [Fibularhizoctonia sp. CBS 109695]